MTTPPPPPGNGGNEPFDPANPYPSSGDGSPSTPDQGPSYTEGTESASGPGFGESSQPGFGESSQPGFGESGQSGPTFGDSAPPVGPPSYGGAPPPAGPPPGGSDSSRTLGIVSIVTGGLGLLCFWCFLGGIPLAIAAVVTGYLGGKKGAETGNADARKYSKIGLILGVIALVAALAYIAVGLATDNFGVGYQLDT